MRGGICFLLLIAGLSGCASTEEWGMADSTELVSVSANTVNEQGVTSSVSVEQEVTRRKTSRIVWWILIPGLIILICLLRKLRRIK